MGRISLFKLSDNGDKLMFICKSFKRERKVLIINFSESISITGGLEPVEN